MRYWILLTIALLALGLAVLPHGAESLKLLAGPRNGVAVADYALAFERRPITSAPSLLPWRNRTKIWRQACSPWQTSAAWRLPPRSVIGSQPPRPRHAPGSPGMPGMAFCSAMLERGRARGRHRGRPDGHWRRTGPLWAGAELLHRRGDRPAARGPLGGRARRHGCDLCLGRDGAARAFGLSTVKAVKRAGKLSALARQAGRCGGGCGGKALTEGPRAFAGRAWHGHFHHRQQGRLPHHADDAREGAIGEGGGCDGEARHALRQGDARRAGSGGGSTHLCERHGHRCLVVGVAAALGFAGLMALPGSPGGSGAGWPPRPGPQPA